jgi:hypothetical protein
MQCEGFPLESYGFLALGSLEDPEREEIQSHLTQGCGICGEHMRKTRRLWYAVAIGAPVREPRPVLRAKILDAVREPGRERFWTWQRAFGSAAVLALAISGGWMIGKRESPQAPPETVVRTVETKVPDTAAIARLERENADLRAKLAEPRPMTQPPAAAAPNINPADLVEARAALAREINKSSDLQGQLDRQRAAVASAQQSVQDAERRYSAALSQGEEARRQLAVLTSRSQELERQVTQYKVLLDRERRNLQGNLQTASLLSDPNLKFVRLRSTQKGRASEGHALIASGAQVVFYGSQLPALPANKAYQLWIIRRQSPAIVSAGVFNPDASNRAFVQFNDPALTLGITALAITDEPAGGSKLPTGHKLLIGE